MLSRNTVFALLLAPMLAAILAGPALADDTNPPSWRGTPDTTFQAWTFPDQNLPHPADPGYFNPNGVPLQDFTLTTPITWLPTAFGRPGVYALGPGGILHFSLPNDNDPNEDKIIWAQVTWNTGPGTEIVSLTPFGPPDATFSNPENTPMEGGWVHSTFVFNLPVCPAIEFFQIRNNSQDHVFIDQVVIDTKCVPEPASLVALAVGIGAIVRKRRQSA